MNPRKFLGCLLIIFGCVSLSYAGFSYTRRVKVMEIGSLVATADKRETIPFSPVIGAVALAAGVVVLARRQQT